MESILKNLADFVRESDPKLKFITFCILGLSVLAAIRKGLLFILLKVKQRTLNKDLNPLFTKTDIVRATQFYIQSKGQNYSPSDDEELGSGFSAATKQKLIPLFIRTILKNEATDNRFHFVFADTGMGKSTFLINLYLAYKNKFAIFKGFRLNIKLIPLGYEYSIAKIKSIENKTKTILLLDAFDEDIQAIDNHERRLSEILKATEEFKYVIITCRTQFFPSENEQPTKTGYFAFGDAPDKEYKFSKLYLSVFDNRDITKYLLKRYKFPFLKSYKRAKRIVDKSPTLVVRPFLLNYINDLINTKEVFQFSFEIYETLIEKWIERESTKALNPLRGVSPQEYSNALYKFSEEFALDLYKNRKQRGGYYMNKDEKIDDNVEIQISDFEEEFKMSDSDKKTRSLLNRNSQGQYKFAHKSILEYFLATRMMKDYSFLVLFEFDGMSSAKRFIKEMSYVEFTMLNGTFLSSNRKSFSSFADMTFDDYENLTTIRPIDLNEVIPLIELIDRNKITIDISNLKNNVIKGLLISIKSTKKSYLKSTVGDLNSPFESNFSPEVKEAISYSREEALRLGNDFIGTEHLLLGILRMRDNPTIGFLKKIGIDISSLRRELEFAIQDKNNKLVSYINSLPLTKQAEKVIRITVLEAKASNSPTVEVEHLFLSILRVTDSVAARILDVEYGFEYYKVQKMLLNISQLSLDAMFKMIRALAKEENIDKFDIINSFEYKAREIANVIDLDESLYNVFSNPEGMKFLYSRIVAELDFESIDTLDLIQNLVKRKSILFTISE